MEGEDLLQSPAMHLNWPLSSRLSYLETRGRVKARFKQATTNTSALGKTQAPYRLYLCIRSYTGFIAIMDVDLDEKSTPEQREALEKENRAKEQREQAGMRIVFC